MKKILAYTLIALGFFSFIQTRADDKIPMDPAIRYGKLKNGMTYYIRHNEEPKERSSFYIAQNVGAILENDDQNGLAHFLEHMAFNGTEHFKGKGIIKFLEKHGVAFGRNINAYTAHDETVYNLSNVPTNKEGLIDSCLLVLHDWSNYLLLTDEEIDAERGVIAEEWRTRRNAQFRMNAKQSKALLYGSKYAERDVIGDLDVIKNFKYKTLRDFYHEWYRTDLQAIIIIGDFDVDAVEQSVKKIFSSIPAVKNAKERKDFNVPDNKEPLYALATDKEATNYYTAVLFKMDAVDPENKDKKYLEKTYIRSMFNMMIGSRIQERLQEENCPFVFGQVNIGGLVRTKNTASMTVAYKEGNWEPALKELATIVEKVREYGFTQAELDRAKTVLLTSMENIYKMRDKINHDSYATKYKEHYMNNTPIPGIEYEYNFVKDLLPRVTLDDLKAIAQHFMKDENMVIIVSGPEKEGVTYQTKEDVVRILDEVKNTKVEAYADTFVDKPLLTEEPVFGRIVKRKEIQDKDLTAVELELSNGIKVYYRSSDIEKETVVFNAHSWGGSSLLSNEQIPDFELLGNFMGSYGLGDFSAMELGKKLTGKIASVDFSIGGLSEGLGGMATPKDLETMFQLLYLRFTKPRFDKKAYNLVHEKIKVSLENIRNSVNQAFQDSVMVTMTDHHPRIRIFDEKFFNEVSFDGIKKIYEDRFANPGDFVFVFSGNFDPKELEAYIEKYIASLPTTSVKEKYVDTGVRPPETNTENHFSRELEVKKATTYVNLHNKYKYNQKNNIYAYVISQLLNKRYLEEIREKEGGTYGVSVSVNTQKRPYNEFELALQFDCDPENLDKLKGIALDEIDQLLKGKLIQSDLEEIKSNILKKRKEKIEKLSYWHLLLNGYAVDGETGMSNYDYNRFVNSIDAKTVVKKANEFLKGAVKVEVIMSSK